MKKQGSIVSSANTPPEPFWVKYNLATQRTLAMESTQQPKVLVKKDLSYIVLTHARH